MVLLALSMLVAFQSPLARVADPGVEGTVRAVEDGRLLTRVLVEAPDDHRWTLTDSLGRYRLIDLTAGVHRLRFQIPGRVSLELTALVPAATTVRLDVELTQKPQELAPVIVVAPGTAADSQAASNRGRPAPLSSTWALRSVGTDRDVESALMAGEDAMSPGTGGGALHFQGGASDQVPLTVDGFPVYGAKHFGSAWSALNPDAVQDVIYRPGSTGSEAGGRLAGVVDVRTSLLGGDSVPARGAVTPGDVRQLVRGELLGGRANFLLSGRRSVRNFFGDAGLGDQNGYDDWLGATALNLGRGRLRALLYRTANQLAFESLPDATSAEASAAPPSNSLEWDSRTIGLAWDGGVPGQTLGLAAWQAELNTSVRWADPNRPLGIANQFVELGVRARSTWLVGEDDVTAGFTVRQLRSRYDARALQPSSSKLTSPELHLRSDPTVITGSLERHWRWGKTVNLEAGLRGSWASFGWFGSEPWLALRVQPLRGLAFTAQTGRAYQFTQSWINEESFVTSVAGMELPVAAGAGRIPVAHADNLSVKVELSPGAGWTLGLEGYARQLANLALVAPGTQGPFTEVKPGFGRGSAAGLIAHSSLVRGPLELAASFGLTRASRTLGAIAYTPAFQRTGFFHAGAMFHLDPNTALGLAMTAGSGQAATPLAAFDWAPYDPWNGNGELSGTPTMLGSLNSYRLPGLRKLDLGFRREWRLRRWPTGRAIVTALTVDNLLNYPNAVGVVQPQPGSRAELLLPAPGSSGWRLAGLSRRTPARHALAGLSQSSRSGRSLGMSVVTLSILPLPASRSAAAVSEDSFDAAFSQLFEQRFASLFRYLMRLTDDRELASDLAQEAFVRLYRRGTLPDTPGAWLVTVAHNLLRDLRRSGRRRLTLLAARQERGIDRERASGAEGEVLAQERREQVRAALDRLSDRDRRALLLRHSGHSYREIASALSVAESGVGTMLIRASQAFRRAYEEIHGAPD